MTGGYATRGRRPETAQPDVVFADSRRTRAHVCVDDPPTLPVIDLEEPTMGKAITTGAGAKTAARYAERQRLYVFGPASGQAWVHAL